MKKEDNKKTLLTDLSVGQKAEIVSIEGGRGARKRLSDMGLTPNTTIEVIRIAPFFGPVNIEVRNFRLVIGRGLASKILVKPK